MTFHYDRTIHFRDTDAAGVVYFANGLALCHEAYEASLGACEIDLKQFFRAGEIIVPITHAHIDFFAPMHCGDRITIALKPRSVDLSTFEVHYEILRSDGSTLVSSALTRHVCVRQGNRHELPVHLTQWLQRYQTESGSPVD